MRRRDLLWLALAWSSAQSAEQPTTLEPLLVSTQRTETPAATAPVGITVIDREEIRRSGARNLAELLGARAGIHVADLYGDGVSATIDMRGFGQTAGSNTLILVDGRRLNNSSDIAPPALAQIDLDDVQRIEIVRGSAGVLYGNQAVGGMVNIITRTPTRSYAELRLESGSYDGRGYRVRTALGDGTRGAEVWASRRSSDNYRANNRTEVERYGTKLQSGDDWGRISVEAEHTRTDQQLPGSLFASEIDAGPTQVHRELARIRQAYGLPRSLLGPLRASGLAGVGAQLALIRSLEGLPGALADDLLGADPRGSAPDYAGDFSDGAEDVLRLALRQALAEGWRLETEISRREEHRDFQISFRGYPGSPSTQDRTTDTLGPRLVGQLSPGDHSLHLTLGADWEHTDYGLRTAFGPQGVEQTIGGVYLQTTTQLGDTWTVTAGMRRGWVDNHITQQRTLSLAGRALNILEPYDLPDALTAASLGVSWAPAPPWRLFVRANQNFRFATVDEHTNPVSGQPVGLNDQTGISYETGASLRWPDGHADLSLYRLDLDNEISFDSSGYYNINLERTQRQGLSLEAQWSPARGWRVGGDYAYTSAAITDGPFAGNDTPLVPRQTGRLFVEKDLPGGWTVNTEALGVGGQVLGGDFANRFPRLDPYSLVNLCLSYRKGPLSLSLRGNNLLDERYSQSGAVGYDASYTLRDAYFPAPGRNFSVQAGYHFD